MMLHRQRALYDNTFIVQRQCRRGRRATIAMPVAAKRTLQTNWVDEMEGKRLDRAAYNMLLDPPPTNNYKYFSRTVIARTVCGACATILDRSGYGYAQWHRKYDAARCKSCIIADKPVLKRFSSIAKKNEFRSGDFTHDALDHPFAESAICYLAQGDYVSGPRKDEINICRWLKSGHGKDDDDPTIYDRYLYRLFKAYDLVDRWNQSCIIEEQVQLNIPGIFKFRQGDKYEGKLVLQEPFIRNYEQFNSNTGWKAEGEDSWVLAMQALSHFTFDFTDGQYLMCHLTGSVEKWGVTLVDPVIHSQEMEFGATDLGPKGISNFFGNHQCNEYCDPEWLKPDDTNLYFEANIRKQAFRRAVTADNRVLKEDETNIAKILELDEPKWIMQNLL
jgi:hypothetical protein